MSLIPINDGEIVQGELVGDLDHLAIIANEQHTLALQAYSSTVEHAFYAGQALAEAKKRVIHGEWLPWLEQNFDASQQTASDYMRVAANYQRAGDLPEGSIRGALKAIGAASSSNGSSQPAPREKKPAALKAVALALHKLAKAAEAIDAIDVRRLADYADEVPVWSGNLAESMKAIDAFNEKLKEISA
jgi:hypothetical protein